MYDNQSKITKSIADAARQVMEGRKEEVLTEELKGDQHKLDKNKNKKIDSEDLEILRGEKKVEEQASKKKIDKFHTDLDKLVHKSFGHSSDEMKKEEVEIEEGKEDIKAELKVIADRMDKIEKSGGRVPLTDPLHQKAKKLRAQLKTIKEDVEQIDELSKQKLGDYAKKASYDAVTRGIDYGSNMDQSGSQHKELSKINKREKGVQKAINRLAKEEVELTEDHFKVGDEVECKASGMEGEVVKVDPKGEGKYYTVKLENGKTKQYAPDELKMEKEDEKEDMNEGTKVQVAPGRTRNIGTHGRAQGSAFGGTDWDKEESEKEEKPKTRRKYGARQNYTRSTRVNESFSDLLESYTEGGIKSLLKTLEERKLEEESTNDEFKAEIKKAQDKSEGKEKADVAAAKVDAVEDMKEEFELEERELTSAETAKKEKYVKSMKKGLQGFKDRYGDRAKEVMYATATKMAKEEVELSEAPSYPYKHHDDTGFSGKYKHIQYHLATDKRKDDGKWHILKRNTAGFHDRISVVHSGSENEMRNKFKEYKGGED